MGLWPVYLLIVSILLLGRKKCSICGINVADENNVGTVLFDKSSLTSHCWTSEESIMLKSRKMFQDLLPKVETLNIQNDQYIADLINYFQVCLKHVQQKSVGKTRHLMLNSLADTMGGYLHSYVLPITKVSFYAGTVKYCNVDKTFQLYSELKDFLRTDGAGWRVPQNLEMFINITPIAVAYERGSKACSRLLFSPTTLQRSSFRKRRLARLKHKRFAARLHNIIGDNNDEHDKKSTGVFLPFLDDAVKPNSIALPFKDHNLWSLYDEESVAILTRYYETSVNCLSSNENYKKILADFNRDFYKWLLQSVYPRLHDEKWYPAFGEVLRIISFLKIVVPNDDVHINRYTTTAAPTHTNVDTSKAGTAIPSPTPSIGSLMDGTGSIAAAELIIIAISSAALISLVLGLTLACYKYHRDHSDECSSCDSPRSDIALLYRNREFCDMDPCPPMSSRKSIGGKIKDWWRQRFQTCPGESDRTLETERYLAAYEYKSKNSPSNRSRKSYKRRKKKLKSVSVSASPSSSPCGYDESKKFFYSTDISSSESESSYR